MEVVELAIDDSWFRDTGPIYVIDGDGTRVALDFEFNAWGGKFTALRRRRDDRPPLGGPRRTPAPVGADGARGRVDRGRRRRHPRHHRAVPAPPEPQPGARRRPEVEAVLGRELGVTTVVWLPFGLALDDDTDGHVDNVAAFARPGALLVQGCADEGEDDWLRCNVNARSARGALDAAGRALDVIDVPVLPYREVDGVACRRSLPQLLRRERRGDRAGVRPRRRCRHAGDHRRRVSRVGRWSASTSGRSSPTAAAGSTASPSRFRPCDPWTARGTRTDRDQSMAGCSTQR